MLIGGSFCNRAHATDQAEIAERLVQRATKFADPVARAQGYRLILRRAAALAVAYRTPDRQPAGYTTDVRRIDRQGIWEMPGEFSLDRRHAR